MIALPILVVVTMNYCLLTWNLREAIDDDSSAEVHVLPSLGTTLSTDFITLASLTHYCILTIRFNYFLGLCYAIYLILVFQQINVTLN